MASPENGTPAPQPTIKIAEDALHPVRTESSYTTGFRPSVRADTQRVAGGIYNTRSLSRASFDRRSASRLSNDRRTEASHATHDVEEGDDWRAGDGKKKQIFRGRTLLWLAYQSIGVIYGDIGTSPLYVFSSTFTETPTYDSLVQALSVIIWSLTIVVTLKYVFIILHADNEGEGGTFSCYSLLTRYANITSRDPREEVTIRIERHLSQDMNSSNRHLRAKIEKNKFTRGLLKTIGVLAVSMVMSDGVLTPAQSVLGAVQGLNVVKPDISRATIIGTTCGILVLLFGIQPLGTTKLAASFAPIVILWLAFNCSFGIYNLVNYDWTVLKAFSPYFAIQFFVQNGTHGWRMLGGILLAFTGVEALFADLGAFSMRAIQLSWMCYTYPCLLLAYIGQAAFISVNPDAYSNPFFNSVPPGMLYPSLVVAILAAIVASQAIITATFQLISQIMKLSYCPQVKVVHTSRIFHGQLYVPFLNWLLMLGTILVTVVYSDTTRLGNAYGVCVMFVTFFDTCMVTLVALIVWKLSPFVVVVPWLVFASVDGLYLSSALTKVPDGAWFTLTLSGILACLFLLWRYGKESQWRAEASDRFAPTHLVKKDEEGKLRLTEKWGGDPLNAIRGFGIFFDKTGVSTPAVFTHFVSKFVSVPDTTVFFHLHPVETPTVPADQRYSITHFTAIPGCYRLVIKHGFMDEVISPDLAALAYEQVRKYIIRTACERLGLGKEDHDSDHEEPELDSTTNDAATTKTSEPTNATTTDEEKTEGATTSATTTSTNIGMPSKMAPVQKQAAVAGRHLQFRSPLPLELRDDKVSAELARLDRSYASKIMYIVGKEQMKINLNSSIGRKISLSVFLWIRENTRAKIANLRLAMDRLVEVGFVKEI